MDTPNTLNTNILALGNLAKYRLSIYHINRTLLCVHVVLQLSRNAIPAFYHMYRIEIGFIAKDIGVNVA